MRLPSLEEAVRQAGATLVRFPMSLLSALVVTAVSMLIIADPARDALPRLLATAALGLPLFTASVTSAERRGAPPRTRWILNLATALGLVLLYRTSLGWTDQLAALRFLQLLLAAHLLAAVAPYLTGQHLDGFWQFNRFLFLRFLVAAFYAVVLWVGLSVALLALDRLFGMALPSRSYAYLWAVMTFGFHPWFFLSGVPRDYQALETLEDYPLGLKVFTQFVLMPLVAIYLAILTAYLGKIIATHTWPNGWIGYLVSGVSATGVLALLLVHPLRQRTDSRWVDAYGRWWFVAILPSLGMLLVAIGKRVGQYGITEPRYFLLVLTLWLTGLALYYGVTASRNIKLIPMTLCAVALLTAVGPWGAYGVARRSQLARFGRILSANGLGRPGAIEPAKTAVSREDRTQLSAILRYLNATHGPSAVAAAVGVPTDTALAWKSGNASGLDDAVARRAMDRIGGGYVARWDGGSDGVPFWATHTPPSSVDVSGFEVARPFYIPNGGWIGSATDSLEIVKGEDAGTLVVRHRGVVVLSLDVVRALRAVVEPDSLPSRRNLQITRPIVVEGEGQGYRVRLVLDAVYGQLKGQVLTIQTGNGLLMAAGFAKPH
jgi:hypothetical protein